MATLQLFARPCRQFFKHYTRSCRSLLQTRAISSSGKDMPTPTSTSTDDIENTKEFQDLKEHIGDADPNKLKNWVSYGWSSVDREEDSFNANLMHFTFFTLIFIVGGYTIIYAPNFKMGDWANREAFLEMDKREKAGLPYIDPYFVPPENVELPSEDELEGVEIIL